MTENKTAEEKKKTVASTTDTKLFSKDQLKASKRYANRKDLLEVLLEENKKYSILEVNGIIEKFMKGKVK